MASYQPRLSHEAPPFSPLVAESPLKPPHTFQVNSTNVDTMRAGDERTQRAASVLSGMSAEDMEAAETLNSLHASMKAPTVSMVHLG